MPNHYDILGVPATATTDEIRRAYHERARHLHPDRVAGGAAGGADDARRVMQDVNEAWRVLREPASRARYDRSLASASAAAAAAPSSPAADDDGWLDRPYRGRPAEPGDLTVAVVRAVPWIAVLVVLGAIVVFTAFARHGGSTTDLIGSCIVTEEGAPKSVPCDEPNDGLVIDVVEQQDLCAVETTAHVVANGKWLCLDTGEGG